VVLSANRIAAKLSAVTVALVTSAPGPEETRILIGPESGLLKESWVNCTDLHTLHKSRLRHRMGRVDINELHAIEEAIRRVLGLRV
jgi:mRNA interferase MazF